MYLHETYSLFSKYLVFKKIKPIKKGVLAYVDLSFKKADSKSKPSEMSNKLPRVSREMQEYPRSASPSSSSDDNFSCGRIKRPFTCTVCDRDFNRKEHLQRHERMHTGSKPFPCRFPGCRKTFSRCDNRDTHQAVHMS